MATRNVAQEFEKAAPWEEMPGAVAGPFRTWDEGEAEAAKHGPTAAAAYCGVKGKPWSAWYVFLYKGRRFR